MKEYGEYLMGKKAKVWKEKSFHISVRKVIVAVIYENVKKKLAKNLLLVFHIIPF